MRKLAIKAALWAIVWSGAILSIVAFGDEAGPMGPTGFGFVPGHYYTSNFSSRVITEYNAARSVVGSLTLPSSLGQDVRGIAFGADGLLYASMSRVSAGFAVVALRSDGSVTASYAGTALTGTNASFGKIAMDSQYLYVAGSLFLTRFRLGDPLSGIRIYTDNGNAIFDVKPLPNGNLFVALESYVDEITTSGVFVRRIVLTGTSLHFAAIRGIEYKPETNILFVTQLGNSGFPFVIIRVNATTGALQGSSGFDYPDDMFLDTSGNLLVGSSTQKPTFYSQGLAPGSSLNGVQQAFVTQCVPAQALNISTRMRVETGNNVLIGGFIVTGAAPKNVAVRGAGPSLAQFGIPDVLADPTLELRDSSGALVRQNDNWQDDPPQAAQLTALGLAPQHPNESGLVASLSPSGYTAILAGKNGGTGVGLLEIYDTNPGANSHLANISTRGFVRTGSNVMIGGFILGGGTNTRVAVRGTGPSLAQFGLSPLLADPTLELRDSNGALLVLNDNWQDDPASASRLTALGLAPANAVESAIHVALPSGAFTAILAGKNGGTGIGLVEIYNVQ
jgi:hypothetical protein